MKLAIVGLGHVAQYQLSALKTIPEVTLSDAFDLNPSTARFLGKEIAFHKSLDDLLSKSDADVILVSTPNVTHFEIAKRVIEAGRAVVVEKPIVSTMEKLDTLIELAERNTVYLAVALHAAYGRDLRWWIEESQNYTDIGPIVGFHAGFYDPYIQEGMLLPQAKSLGGSWFDSGINALSVIGKIINPSSMRVIRSDMSKLPQIPCDQIQGSALLQFKTDAHRGFGIVDTNWSLNLDEKITRLFYSTITVVLHHSMETVILEKKDGSCQRIQLSNGRPRLVNHYEALFKDLYRMKKSGRSNLSYAIPIHRLLLTAAENVR